MKVRELIEQLKQFDPERPVLVSDYSSYNHCRAPSSGSVLAAEIGSSRIDDVWDLEDVDDCKCLDENYNNSTLVSVVVI